jgi:hypothetical protein
LTQGELFDLPNVAPLKRPKTQRPGTGPVTYTDYKVKWPVPCADCELVVYEALMDKRLDAPPIRKARFKRTQAGLSLLLCSEHKQLREQDEAGVGEKKSS